MITEVGAASAFTYVSTFPTSWAIPKPSGAAAGDYLWLQLTYQTYVSLSSLAGWTLDASRIVTGLQGLSVLHLQLTGGEGSTIPSPTMSAGDNFSGVCTAALRGVDPSNPVDVIGSWADQASFGTGVAAPSVHTVIANDLLLGFFGEQGYNGVTVTVPSGMTKETESQGHFCVSTLATQAVATPGDTGTRMFSAASQGSALLIAVKPLVAPVVVRPRRSDLRVRGGGIIPVNRGGLLGAGR